MVQWESDTYGYTKDMILQVEGCVDCLKGLLGNTYEYLFLIDHSNRCDCVALHALNPSRIWKTFWGKQLVMRDSVILDKSFVGSYNHDTKLKVCETQHITFSHTDTGPFYLNDTNKQAWHYNAIVGNKTENLPKPQMIKKLLAKGLSKWRGNKEKLR